MRVLLLLLCGSWLASDGGLSADQSPTEVTQFPCGSEPAREGASAFNIYGACTTAFASRLAPTGKLSAFSQNMVGCQAAIAGKPAPTVLIVYAPCGAAAPLKTMSASSSTALDLPQVN